MQVTAVVGFCPTILQVCSDEERPAQVRQAAAIYLKNCISKYWEDAKEKGVSYFRFVLNDGMCKTFRSTIFWSRTGISYVRTSSRRCRDHLTQYGALYCCFLGVIMLTRHRSQLAQCIETIVRRDFPGNWPTFADEVIARLTQQPLNARAASAALLALYRLIKCFQ